MTGKKSLNKNRNIQWHDLGFVFGKSGWILLVGLVAFLILIPFFTAGLPGDSIFNIEVTHEQMKFRLIHEDMTVAVIVAAIGMGLLCGVSLFRFVQEKKETTIFLSMGITRKQLFVNRTAAGFSMLALMSALPMLLSAGLNMMALGKYQGLIRNAVYLWLGIFVIASVSFLCAVIMSLVSGTLLELILYWGCVMSAPTILCYSINLLMDKLYWGNAWGVVTYNGNEEVKDSLMESFAFLNPLLFFKDRLDTHAQFMRPLSTDTPEMVSWELVLAWLGVVFALTVAAWILLKHWKAENSGIMGKNRVLPQVVISLTGFLTFSIVFTYLLDFAEMLAIAFGIAVFLAVHFFWRKTGVTGQLKIKEQLILLVGQGGVILLVCILFSTGFFHQAERFLENGKVTEARVTYVGNPSLLYEEASGSSTGRGYYVVSELTLTEEVSVEKVKELQLLFEKTGKKKLEATEEISDTVIPYDVSFSYTEEDGTNHSWYYDRITYSQLEEMLALEELEEVQDRQSSLFAGEEEGGNIIWSKRAYNTGTVYVTDRFLSNTFELTLTEEQRAELLSSMQKDIENLTLEERYYPEEEAKAVLMFSQNGEMDYEYFSYHLDNAFLYLTSEYENTLGWLEENEILEYLDVEPVIEAIVLQRMDPYIGMNDLKYPMGMYFMSYCADSADEFLIQKDFGDKYIVTDRGDIEEIAEVLQNGYFMSRGGYLAAVKLEGEERYRYMFIPQTDIPSFIRR